MSTDTAVDLNPHKMHSITPHLVCAGASDAIAFYEKAFGAVELARLPGPDGRLMHAMVRIGDSPLMLVDESAEWGMLGPKARNGTSVTLHFIVADADATFAQAIAAGASVVMPLADMFWGDRYGVLSDPFGHHWSVATPQRVVSMEEAAQAMASMSKPA